MDKPRAIDLFCGCGGLTLGLKWAGFNVIGAVDNDPLAVETYEKNHPEVHVWLLDIRNLAVTTLKRNLNLKKSQLELLAGCPPCQGFSTIRTLNGSRCVEDGRNDLIFEFLRFVEGLAPKAVMMENVPGLARDKRFVKFCSRLEDLGYFQEHNTRDAADYGVPQRRKRLILLAGRNGSIPFAKPVAGRRTVRDTIADLPPAGQSGDSLHDLPERRSARVRELIARIPKDGGSRLDLVEDDQLPCHRRCDGFKDVYGRITWNDVAPTITAGCFNPSKGRFLHPIYDRAITMREAALIQSFPDGYRFPLRRGKTGVAWLIGNALPPEFIRRIASPVVEYVRGIA